MSYAAFDRFEVVRGLASSERIYEEFRLGRNAQMTRSGCK